MHTLHDASWRWACLFASHCTIVMLIFNVSWLQAKLAKWLPLSLTFHCTHKSFQRSSLCKVKLTVTSGLTVTFRLCFVDVEGLGQGHHTACPCMWQSPLVRSCDLFFVVIATHTLNTCMAYRVGSNSHTSYIGPSITHGEVLRPALVGYERGAWAHAAWMLWHAMDPSS
jgi:hypothetical protein